MEKYINIPTFDWFEIKWILNWKEKSDKLIIFVHGFKWSMNEAHYICAKDYFLNKWYDIFRFNLYNQWDSYRKLHETSVFEHSTDMQNVLSYFEKQYQKISIIGHSLGCPTIIWVNQFPENLKNIIFWDPALSMKESAATIYQKGVSYVVPSSGKLTEVSKIMLEEFKNTDYIKNLWNLSTSLDKVKIVYASEARHIKLKPQIDNMWIQSCIIEWANHGFTQEWKYEELFDKTLEYITQ